MDSVPTNDDELLTAFGIGDARTKNITQHRNEARASNGTDSDKWIPVTHVSLIRDVRPQMALTAWMETADMPGEYMSVITLFRTNKGFLECFVPPHTTYYIGVGIVN